MSQSRSSSQTSFDHRLEEEVDDHEEVIGEQKVPLKKRIPFQRIGISFLVLAIVVAIITITVPAAIRTKINQFDDGILFRALFVIFLLCLFVCLWCIYYLGGETHAWEDPERTELNFSFSNVTAVAGIVIEFIQLCSFSFNENSAYLGSEELRNSNYLAIPFSPGKAFDVMYWIMFGLAFSPYLFVVFVRLALHFFTRQYGESFTSGFVGKYQQKIYSILWFLVNTMYLPVIGTMFGGIDCTFTDSTGTLDSDPSIDCLTRVHIPFIVCSLVALIMYYPAASFAQSQTQDISDIKFKPRVVFIFVQGKVVLAAMTLFATNYVNVYLIAVLIVNIVFLGINIWLEPCIVEWVNRMRTCFFSFCTIATIVSWIARANIPDYVPLILLLLGWAVFALFFYLFYHFNLNTIVTNGILRLMGKRVLKSNSTVIDNSQL